MANGEITGYSYDCENYEYGDVFSVMGSSDTGHHNAFHKKEIGWLTEENILAMREGTFKLRSLETFQPSGEIQTIKVQIKEDISFYAGDDNLFYVVELRQPLDYDVIFMRDFMRDGLIDEIYKGVSLRMATEKDELRKQTNLISFNERKQWILVGESFIDDINGVKINLKSLEGNGADAVATVSVEQIPGREPPDFNSPLIYYDFNDEILLSQRLTDNAGYVRGGLVEGSPSYPEYLPENFDGGIFFQGNGDSPAKSGYVTMSKFQDIFIARNNAFTISTWLNLQNYPKAFGIIYESGIFNMRLKEDGILESFSRFKVEDGYSKAFISSRNPLIKNRWYYLALVFDGEKLRLYLNGLEEGNIDKVEFEGRMVRIIGLDANYEVFPFLGGETYGYGLNGILDEFKIYARGLSEEEIMRLYRNPPLQAQAKFIRGDSNSDGKVDISDAVFILRWLFQGIEKPKCEDAGDVNDDGNIDVSDAIYTLIYLFRGGGREPPAPFPEAGLDLTEDELGCGS